MGGVRSGDITERVRRGVVLALLPCFYSNGCIALGGVFGEYTVLSVFAPPSIIELLLENENEKKKKKVCAAVRS